MLESIQRVIRRALEKALSCGLICSKTPSGQGRGWLALRLQAGDNGENLHRTGFGAGFASVWAFVVQGKKTRLMKEGTAVIDFFQSSGDSDLPPVSPGPVPVMHRIGMAILPFDVAAMRVAGEDSL